MKIKADELRRKQSYLESRLRLGEAKEMINDINQSIEAPDSSFAEAERKIDTMEARNQSIEQMNSNSLEDELQELMSGAYTNDKALEAFMSGNDAMALESGSK